MCHHGLPFAMSDCRRAATWGSALETLPRQRPRWNRLNSLTAAATIVRISNDSERSCLLWWAVPSLSHFHWFVWCTCAVVAQYGVVCRIQASVILGAASCAIMHGWSIYHLFLLFFREGDLSPGVRGITSPRSWSNQQIWSRMLQRYASVAAAHSAFVMLAFCQMLALFKRLCLSSVVPVLLLMRITTATSMTRTSMMKTSMVQRSLILTRSSRDSRGRALSMDEFEHDGKGKNWLYFATILYTSQCVVVYVYINYMYVP